MAHFAELDQNNVVLRVVVIHNADCTDEAGVERESIGAAFCTQLFGGSWVQTSYNARFRKNYAGVGFVYDAERDAFIAPQPFASWTLDQETCQWVPPSADPSTPEAQYVWDEATQTWVLP